MAKCTWLKKLYKYSRDTKDTRVPLSLKPSSRVCGHTQIRLNDVAGFGITCWKVTFRRKERNILVCPLDDHLSKGHLQHTMFHYVVWKITRCVSIKYFEKIAVSLLSPPTKSGGDIGTVRNGASVRPSGVSDHYLEKVNTQFISGVGMCWVSVQNWFDFEQRWLNGGQNITENGPKWWFLTIIRKSICTTQFKLVMYTRSVSFQKCFGVGQCWPNFGHLVTKKLL